MFIFSSLFTCIKGRKGPPGAAGLKGNRGEPGLPGQNVSTLYYVLLAGTHETCVLCTAGKSGHPRSSWSQGMCTQ